MMSSTEILSFLRQNKNYLKENFHCSKIGLFGSFARNEQTENSDIDIIVTYEPDTKNIYDCEIALRDYLSSHFNRKVDLCAEKWIKSIFKPIVLKETIYA